MVPNSGLMTALWQTEDSWGPLALRASLGLVLLAHGLQKLFGWFGGYGFTGTMDYFTNTMGIPWILSLLVVLLESLGALALILGMATRLISISLIFLGSGIMVMVHLQYGFFMNWAGNQPGEGIEYFILWIGMALALTFTGGGRYSVDRLLTR